MSDLDDLLRQVAPRYDRSLTAQRRSVIMRAVESKQTNKWGYVKYAFVSLGVCMMLPAFVFAAGQRGVFGQGWDSYVDVSEGKTEMILPNGNTLVGFRSKECNEFGGQPDDLSAAAQKQADQTTYYEIKKNQGITVADVREYMMIDCAGSLAEQEAQDVKRQISVPADMALLTGHVPITRTGSNSIYINTYVMPSNDANNQQGSISPVEREVVLTDHPIMKRMEKAIVLEDVKPVDMAYVFVLVPQRAVPLCHSGGGTENGCDIVLASKEVPMKLAGLFIAENLSYDIDSKVQLGGNIFTAIPCDASLNGFCSAGELDPSGAYLHPVPYITYPTWRAILLGTGAVIVLSAVVLKLLGRYRTSKNSSRV